MVERPKDIKLIVAEVLERETAEERAAYLTTACGDDAALRAEVESLLRLAPQMGDFLEAPILGSAVILDEPPVVEGPGSAIGRYKLLEKIGEGGMAVVYMAEQTEPIRRKVALKIIKLGMDTKQVIARFEAERQALAMMDHPCIARVLDAGATETGRPYFVMELVTGVSLTEYCDRNNLSTKDRLMLFLRVCQAVQHAHTKGIIHRDLKPSNVMVTHHDGKPVPKVIDFGIAKATNQKLTEKTLFTRYAHIIGTPAYMSPEQAELSDLDIDTRSDIYSLGVLLYELLTGTTPFSEEELRNAGYIEMQRIIREQEPVKPSTKLTTLGDTLTEIATHRGCTPDLLHKAVRGDLDWIAMKSLEKDRTRRYETASGLAEDIRRHLESEPVLARGPSTPYLLRKFLRRHRVQALVGLTVAILAALVAVLLSIWNQERLQWERDRLQLAEADALRQQALLSQAQGQYAGGERDAALETIRPILDSPHVGGKARLLQAGILVDNRRFDEATTVLKTLLDGRPEIAGAAHALLARILRESGDLNTQRLQEIGEHRRQAEILLPETADAYFSRAMTAITVKDQLAALDRAVELDARHYEARRLRAFTYYASRKYGPMSEEAFAMQVLRDHDPLGHSLRATALRELGRYREAVAEYDRAISLSGQEEAQYLDLAMQRLQALLRMGDYARVIAEAPRAMTRWSDRPVFSYQLFCALTASGEYEKAAAVFREIVRRTPTARNEFWSWAMKYAFDTLEAGRSWHGDGPAPTGAAFLPLVEAQETYRSLSAKARRVVTNGFSAEWSRDGRKLAFSLGVHGYNGVALYDPATKETELLIVPGKDPRWSPDGKSIAFVRDCQALRLEELTATERKSQDRPWNDEEVWLMKSDGSEPRRLAQGGSPSWSRDGAQVYYHSRRENMLCAIPVAPPNVEPKRIMACSSAFPSISPDEQQVAYRENNSLTVRDLASQAVVARWRVPFDTWGGPAWSPTGKELCWGADSDVGDRTGLWIYSLDSNEPVKVLTGQITVALWAPDGTRLAFALRPPFQEIWTADLDPNVSTLEALGPGQTLEEYGQEMLRLCTSRIQTDPQDADAYCDRARYYDYLHDRANATADMRRWSAVMSGRSPSDLSFGIPRVSSPSISRMSHVRSPSDASFGTGRALRRVLKLPLDCELVFSAERPVNSIPILSVAFGQKGSSEMKTIRIPMVVMSLVGLGFLSGPSVPSAHADFTFGEPTNLGPPLNTSGHEGATTISSDGLELFIDSDWSGDYDLWVATRATTADPWGKPVNLGSSVNSSAADFRPSISPDGLELYFTSFRSGNWDIWVAKRASLSDSWGQAANVGSPVNTSAMDIQPSISGDGLELFFASRRPGGSGVDDLWVVTRSTIHEPWSNPVNLGAGVNSPYIDNSPCLSPDGLLLFFESDRPGGYGSYDLWVTRRATKNAAWGPAVNLGAPINTAFEEHVPGFSPDGREFYFVSPDRPGGLGGIDTWQAPILPIVDFNADGKVDLDDLRLLIDNWGTDNTLYDIGPFAWGDGKVDIEDLKVFIAEWEKWEKQNPPVVDDGQ